MSKSPAVFDEKKLRWMNGRYLRELALDDLTARLEERTGKTGLKDGGRHRPGQDLDARRVLASWASSSTGPVDDPVAWEKTMTPEARDALADAREALADTEPFEPEQIEGALRGVADAREVKPKAVFQPVRVAIAGTTVSPGIFESVALLGRGDTLERIDAALARLDG